MAKVNRHREALNRIVGFLEYLFTFIIIVECNSMYNSIELADISTDMSRVFYGMAIVVLLVLLGLHVVLDRRAVSGVRRFLPLWGLLVAYSFIFCMLNARQVGRYDRQNYIRNFLVLLPLMVLYLKLKQEKGEALELLYKHSDIVCVIAGLSLAVYLASVFHVDTMPSDAIYTNWSAKGTTREQINLLNICLLSTTGRWQVSGIELLRNRGIFVEALMFSIPLITALSTELFLKGRADCGSLYRAVLLSVAALTAFSTVGIMLLAVAWGAKLIEWLYRRKKGGLALLVILAVVVICAFLFMAKKNARYTATEVSGTSIDDHIEDYRAGLKAFLHRPLLGGGYNYEDYIRQFMDPAKVARNPGLSNSAASVLAEGGVMLGVLCMLPFLIFLMYGFKRGRRDRSVALWAMGPLGLYISVIFKYHMFLMFLMAFGYSLIEVGQRESGGRKSRLGLVELKMKEVGGGELLHRRRRALGTAGAVVMVLALFTWLGLPVCRFAYRFLRTHQFSMGQSPLKAFGFGIALLFHGVFIRNAVRRRISAKRLLWLFAWDAVYLLIYPRLYSDIATILAVYSRNGGRLEFVALLGVFLAGGLMIAEIPAAREWWPARGTAVIAAMLACAAICFFALQTVINRQDPVDDGLMAPLNSVVEAASGKVYVGEMPSLVHRGNAGISWSSTGISGYETCDNATVLLKKGNDRDELFQYDFQVAELTDSYIIYSNDDSVISKLSGQGTRFFRYYPFPQPVDMQAMAAENGIELTDTGALVVTEATPLSNGNKDLLPAGQYTADYTLHVSPQDFAEVPGDTVLCSLAVSRSGGKKALAQMKLMAENLDAEGNGTFSLPFDIESAGRNLEYRVKAQSGLPIYVTDISLRKTPDYVKAVFNNCYGNPIRETCYTLDGEPYVLAEGYTTLERSYSVEGLVKSVRYYDADMNPVLTKGGYAEIRYAYNAKRSPEYVAYFGTTGEPQLQQDGYAALRRKYDAFGNVADIWYFGTDGRAVMISKGYSHIHREYNNRKKVIYEAYYGVDEKRAAQKKGYSAMAWEYDSNDRVSVCRYLDDGDRPMLNSDGVAECRYLYDDAGRVIQEEHRDTEGNRTLDKTGTAVLVKKYDDAGNLVLQTCCGTDGNPSINKSGYARVEYGYDGEGNRVLTTYQDTEGKATEDKKGVAIIRREYDTAGHWVVEYYYNAKGQPTQNKSGVAEIHRVYDEAGNRISEEKYDLSGSVIQ